MSQKLNMAAYLIKLKKKQDQKDLLEKLIEEETQKQNYLMEEIDQIMHFHSIDRKKEIID